MHYYYYCRIFHNSQSNDEWERKEKKQSVLPDWLTDWLSVINWFRKLRNSEQDGKRILRFCLNKKDVDVVTFVFIQKRECHFLRCVMCAVLCRYVFLPMEIPLFRPLATDDNGAQLTSEWPMNGKSNYIRKCNNISRHYAYAAPSTKPQ